MAPAWGVLSVSSAPSRTGGGDGEHRTAAQAADSWYRATTSTSGITEPVAAVSDHVALPFCVGLFVRIVANPVAVRAEHHCPAALSVIWNIWAAPRPVAFLARTLIV